MPRQWMTIFSAALFICSISFFAIAQEGAEEAESSEPTPPPAQTEDKDDTADEVIRDLLKGGNDPEKGEIKPSEAPNDNAVPVPPVGPGTGANVDSAVIGVAPGDKQPKLRREGEFVIARRGRIVRAPDAQFFMFVFEADAPDSQEPPMMILPCSLLESIESIIQQRGDEVVFILSGQITLYRGANYILPTMMKVAVDTNNVGKGE